MLVVANHLDYHEAAGGFQINLLHGHPRDLGYTDQPVVLPVLNMGMTTAFSRHQERGLPQLFEDSHCKANLPSIGQLPLMHLIWSHGLVYVKFA